MLKTYGRDLIKAGIFKLLWTVFVIMGGGRLPCIPAAEFPAEFLPCSPHQPHAPTCDTPPTDTLSICPPFTPLCCSLLLHTLPPDVHPHPGGQERLNLRLW